MEQQLDKYGLPLLESIPLGKSEYVMVKTRLQYFRKHYENASIDTDHVFFDGESIMCKTTIHVDGKLVATGMAHEEKSKNNINATSFVEVCETSAVGRALGMMGIGITNSVATYDEVKNAMKQQEANVKADELMQYKAESLSVKLIMAIEADDEIGITEVEKDYRGDTPLATRVKLTLSPEHQEYMAERKERKSLESKEKAQAKHETNVQAAKEFAEKQKNSEV
mgnify:FL=1|tara:strand:+ start:17 stop:688 length:672 start_codon:yes stop_codon:yes gene_type:complete